MKPLRSLLTTGPRPRAMNTRMIPVMAALWLAALSLPSTAETLVSLDPRAKLITVDNGNGLKAYRLKDAAEVRVNGVAGQLDQLQPGMQLTLGFADPQTVARIIAAAAGKPPLGTASSGSSSQRRISLKIKVDGKDLIKVKDGKLWIEHEQWSKPMDISVNGRSWKPQWNGNVSDQFITFIPPLVPFEAAPVEVKKIKGRGSANLKQAPTAENQQTLAVEINDSTEAGAAAYEVHITW